MAGSPEKTSLVFEITRFAAGSINLPTLNISSSLNLNSRFVSAPSLHSLHRMQHNRHEILRYEALAGSQIASVIIPLPDRVGEE